MRKRRATGCAGLGEGLGSGGGVSDGEPLLWKSPGKWFSIHASHTGDGLRNWYINVEHPTSHADDRFDTVDLTVDLVITPDPGTRTWKTKTTTPTSDAWPSSLTATTRRWNSPAAMEERTGPFADADRRETWRWKQAWPAPRLPRDRACPADQ
ncbi:DUF402 domain-containing protein [Streptomyces sp. NBC_01590]|uniref:DUF402 domain-containing protein n=1 Tax=Streptomyces sp. NBC_01590 TaxID=2975887 RepID=UPI003870E26F